MRTVLFLCTGNYYRSRFAELLFNSLAADEQLSWRADSRGLALERGLHNVGPISADTLAHLKALGITVPTPQRLPLTACHDDFAAASHVVAVKQAEHRPLIEQRFTAWADRVEYWHVHDVDYAGPAEALLELEQHVRGLAHRLRDRAAG